jgi:hypothetical protein
MSPRPLQGADVPAEPFDCPFVALWHELDGAKDQNDCRKDEREDEGRAEILEHGSPQQTAKAAFGRHESAEIIAKLTTKRLAGRFATSYGQVNLTPQGA